MLKQLTIPGLAILLTVLFSAGFFATPEKACAGIVPLEGMQYNVNASLEDNLKSLVGKKVYVTLDSGKTFTGTVKEVGNHLMWLEKLDGKDFFDALIRINTITAIDAKFRDMK
jgi:hypothetical protein